MWARARGGSTPLSRTSESPAPRGSLQAGAVAPWEYSDCGFADGDGAAVDDLLDDIAELVLGNKGEVVVVPGDTMPTSTGLAAIYRF